MDLSGMLGIFVQGNLYKAQEIFMTDMPISSVYHYSDAMLVADYLVGWDCLVLGTIDLSTALLIISSRVNL
jgi:hypothetical protein